MIKLRTGRHSTASDTSVVTFSGSDWVSGVYSNSGSLASENPDGTKIVKLKDKTQTAS
jgi:hypothetical protein